MFLRQESDDEAQPLASLIMDQLCLDYFLCVPSTFLSTYLVAKVVAPHPLAGNRSLLFSVIQCE
jgi:hypothetical protein